ncbi:FecR domain-containing protein [Blastomonas sp. UPD001]|uniref:FecR family protein n=1 Tax=Blastomonas sp. UPD001 TaxID=2217673 RepID=UPI0013001ED7|nr:FecR domain-containing protein [Blastomonas sp. UPD001]
MTDTNEQIRQEALEWVLASQEADFAGWDALTDWLDADARNNEAYDAAMAAGSWMADMIAAAPALPQPANDETPALPSRARSWRSGYLALAAAILAILLIPLWQMRPQPYSVITPNGQTRTIALDDGSRILVNGGTRLALDRSEPRFARLERGEAMFIVRHDDSDPFVVEAGDVRLVDAGTAFNVVRSGAGLDVAVSEGAVIVNPEGENVRLNPGGRAQIDGASGRITLSDVAASHIGGWRSGQIAFADAPLGEVAEALERTLGTRVTVSPELAAARFSGILQVAGRHADALPQIAPVLGARAVRRAEGWELVNIDAQP